MKKSAHIQTTITIIEEILKNSSMPADRFLSNYFRDKRYIGSSDRRAIKDLTYNVIRHLPGFEFYCSNHANLSGRLILALYLHIIENQNLDYINALFNGDNYAPTQLSYNELNILDKAKKQTIVPDWVRASAPKWLWPHLQARFKDLAIEHAKALNEPIGFDIRVNSLKSNRDAVLGQLMAENISATPTPHSPLGLRLSSNYALQDNTLHQNGVIEIQDEGSQLIALLVNAKQDMTVLDMCAGAGGKTLAIAATMQNKGIIIATDIHSWRLDKAKMRLKRAGANNANCRVLEASWLKRQQNRFDRVLIDVPCSGTGTWRRNPELKIRLTEQDLNELVLKQQQIMQNAASSLKEGGVLIYSTCSVLDVENENQVEWFLENHPNFKLIDYKTVWSEVIKTTPPCSGEMLQLLPYLHKTDGFFVSLMQKI